MINKKISFCKHASSKMAKFERKQQNYLYFSRRKTLRKSTIHVNYWAVDRSNTFPCYKQLFEKSEEHSIQLENAVTWSKSNLNVINIYEEKYIKCLDMSENKWSGKLYQLLLSLHSSGSNIFRWINYKSQFLMIQVLAIFGIHNRIVI
jgi:hypothetical protein